MKFAQGIVATLGLITAVVAVAPAQADNHHDNRNRPGARGRHDGHGNWNHHRQCRVEWHHHHRVKRCW